MPRGWRVGWSVPGRCWDPLGPGRDSGGTGRRYEKVCSHCHEANVGPVLKGRQLPVAYVERVVRYGNRAMPSFRPSEIDDAALVDVARLIGGGAPLAKAKE
ncbi:c-type cytochrome [Aromatoleum anaerobium]|uniref:c-type cytochrome n=1 Tax=Aromatoleum anaerobium TaxID=182180 RepID=UPI001FF3E0CC|nr:cytochrome c [Aromatoleum anaerobium]MCK0506139.1 cytochrome c [Aromatoleum anaerobium]